MISFSERRHVRIVHYSPWADRLEIAGDFLARIEKLDVRTRVTEPTNLEVVAMARLDCDWHGECARSFSTLYHNDIEFLPAFVVGRQGMADLVNTKPLPGEEWWLVFMGQHPQALAGIAGRLLAVLARNGFRFLYYAFDEASRTMPCFPEIAPHLDVLIHDELPLCESSRRQLRCDCLVQHRSWVANVLPFSAPFVEEPENKIVFLGSKLGLTEHRQRQINFLKTKFKDRFQAIHDHSVAVNERTYLSRFKASLCPEGRKFSSLAMSATHTDRPFWSGCLGMVPISENSRNGDRLESLYSEGLVERYGWGDLNSLALACDRALSASLEDRRRIYQYFNRNETVSAVVASVLHIARRAPACERAVS